MIRAIACVDKNWGIGKDNHLLFDLPEDMEFFKRSTTGSMVCMGYNTYLSLPGPAPLKNRENVVICPRDVEIEDVICVHTMSELAQKILSAKTDVYVIGGAMLYKSMLPYCEEVILTKVISDGGADVFFENLNEISYFELIANSGIKRSVKSKLYCILKYRNNKCGKLEDLIGGQNIQI